MEREASPAPIEERLILKDQETIVSENNDSEINHTKTNETNTQAETITSDAPRLLGEILSKQLTITRRLEIKVKTTLDPWDSTPEISLASKAEYQDNGVEYDERKLSGILIDHNRKNNVITITSEKQVPEGTFWLLLKIADDKGTRYELLKDNATGQF